MEFDVPVDQMQSWRSRPGSALLVVEEEPTVRAILVDVLQADARYDVEQAETGEGCLRLIQEREPPYEAVLVDDVLHGLGVEDVTAVLAEYRPALPVVRLSRVLREGETRSSSLEAILAKSFFPERLIAAIHRKVADTCEEAARSGVAAFRALGLMSRAERAANEAAAIQRRSTNLVDAARRIRLERLARIRTP
jgi:CheY-like chemotaxis protein